MIQTIAIKTKYELGNPGITKIGTSRVDGQHIYKMESHINIADIKEIAPDVSLVNTLEDNIKTIQGDPMQSLDDLINNG